MCSPQSTYAPLVPSPLNPAIFPSSARNSLRVGEALPFRMRPVPVPTPVQATKRRPGPSEKLLRRKAAEAWKMEALHRQVVEYEKQALGALMAKGKVSKDDSEPAPPPPPPRRHPRRRRVSRSTAVAAAAGMETVTEEQSDAERNEEEEEEEEETVTSEKVVKWHHFLRMPTLGFLAPKKLAKSLRFVRVLASWRVRRRHKKADRD